MKFRTNFTDIAGPLPTATPAADAIGRDGAPASTGDFVIYLDSKSVEASGLPNGRFAGLLGEALPLRLWPPPR